MTGKPSPYQSPYFASTSLKFTAIVVSILFLVHSLQALEIRLKSPNKFYQDNGEIFIDVSATESLLTGDDAQNLFYDIPITITYYIEFYEDRLIFDDLLANIVVVRRVSYDRWSDQFFVEEGENKYRYHNLTQLRNNMGYLRRIRLITTDLIDEDKNYYFKTRIAVKIKNFTLYYYLVNNLISIFKYKTTYITSPVYSGEDILRRSQALNQKR